MSEEKEAEETNSCSPTLPSTPQQTQQQQQIQTNQTTLTTTQLQAVQIQPGQTNLATTKIQAVQIQSAQLQMQVQAPSPQGIVAQAPQVQQQQALTQNNMTQVMSQGPQTTPTHAIQSSLPPQTPQQAQYYVHTSVGTGMQGPPAIAPAPGPQTSTTTTVSALHQPLMHHLAPQTLTHPGVSPSPMPQFSPQVQVIQSGIPGTPYLQQVYQNAQGQIIMPSNLTLQPTPGMSATPIQQGTINPINSSIQVITAGKPFQGQIAPHMLAGGKPGVIQQGQAAGYGNHPAIPSSVSQTVLIGQLGGQLGVISSQPPNILPAQSTSQKAGGDLHKVNNMQAATFGPIQPSSITWATPGAALHSPTLLAAQNPPIFIRGSQPGQEGLYIQSGPAQPMAPNNNMVQSISSMAVGPQQQPPNKVRSTLDAQTNIQPKVASMRPPLLPSGPQIRPGASVSTQTAAGVGQAIVTSQMVAPRSQVQKYFSKVRGKNANNRMATTVAMSQQQLQQQQQQPSQIILQPQTPLQQPQLQPQQIISIQNASSAALSGAVANPVVMANGSMPTLASIQKSLTPAASSVSPNVSQNNRPGSLVHPSSTGLQTTTSIPSSVSLKPHSSKSLSNPTPTSSFATSSVLTKLSNIVGTVPGTPETLSSSSSSSHQSSSTSISSTPISSSTPRLQTQTHPPVLSQNSTMPPQLNGISSSSNTKPNTPADQTTTQSGLMETPLAVTSQEVQSENCVAWKTMMPSAVVANGTSLPNGSPATSVTTAAVPGVPSSKEMGSGTNPVVNGNGISSHSGVPQSPSGPPKAMVKPQVLTHVIEGFVIHEASEPFPVNRSSILSDVSKTRNSNPSNTATVLPQGAVTPKTPDKSSEENTGKDSLKGDAGNRCEVCGKVEIRSKYKKSKRFCSSSCAKKYNLNCAKRIGVSSSPDESPSKKPKSEDGTLGEPETPINGTGEIVTPKSSEFGGSECEMAVEEDDLSDTPKVDILKWTVRDVVEFIQNLPGCQDYAEDFELQEIDGQALMLLKADHLMSAMSIKLGPALKICAKIEAMRIDRKEN